MRKVKMFLSRCFLALLFFLLIHLHATAIDPNASLPDMQAQPGDVLQIPLNAENLQFLEGLDIVISFDSQLISVDDASLQSGILESQNYSMQFNNNSSDQVTITIYATENLFSGSGEVLFLTISCINAGFTDLIFEKFDVNETSYLANVTNGSITIASGQSQTITLLEGWNSLSTYLTPDNANIIELMSGLEQQLVIIQNYHNFYQPGNSASNLLSWNYKSGYFIKVNNATQLVINGNLPADRSIQILTGWNIIPVLSNAPVSIQNLFAGNLDKIEIMREGVGVKLFWPDKNINTLENLLPGESYLIKANQEFQISFN